MTYIFNKTFFLFLLFVFVSELAVFNLEFFWLSFYFLVLSSLFLSWYFLKKASLVTLVTLIPFVEFFLLNFMSEGYQGQAIILSSAFVFSMFFKKKLKKSTIILVSFLEFIILVFSIFVFQSFLDFPSFVYLFFIYLVSFSLFFSSISSVINLKFSLKIRLFYFSLILAFLITELFWFITKLPFNFITASFIVFLIYYSMWDITIRYFASSLTKKSLYINIAFLAFILFVIFSIIKFFLI